MPTKQSQMKYTTTPDEKAMIVKMFMEGRTVQQISKSMNIYRTKVKILLEQVGLLKSYLDV